jgi:hypothetical protein
MGGSSSDHALTVALANPFSPQAVGVKIPDDDSSRSVAVTIHDSVQLATNANGHADVCFSAKLSGETYVTAATTGSGGVLTWNSPSDLTDTAAYVAAFDTYRVCSWGVRVYNTLAPTSQKGIIRIITCPESPNTKTPFITNGGLHEDLKIFPASETDIHWISRPQGTEWKQYVKFDDTAYAPDWDHVHIRYEGGPVSTSNALMVEVIYHVECQIALGGVTATMATPAADHKPHVLSASAKTLAKHGGSHAGASFGGLISRFAKSALNGVVNHFLPGFTQPQRSYPMIVD